MNHGRDLFTFGRALWQIVFPSFIDDEDTNERFSTALEMIQMCFGGDDTREASARKEFTQAWMNRYRSVKRIRILPRTTQLPM